MLYFKSGYYQKTNVKTLSANILLFCSVSTCYDLPDTLINNFSKLCWFKKCHPCSITLPTNSISCIQNIISRTQGCMETTALVETLRWKQKCQSGSLRTRTNKTKIVCMARYYKGLVIKYCIMLLFGWTEPLRSYWCLLCHTVNNNLNYLKTDKVSARSQVQGNMSLHISVCMYAFVCLLHLCLVFACMVFTHFLCTL